MPKSYSKFTTDDLIELGLTVSDGSLFENTVFPLIQPSRFLLETLEKNKKRKLRSEKAKSEFLISPIIGELEDINNQKFALYSGYKFKVEPELGLTGFCDYVLSFEPKSPIIQAPVFFVVESKNDNLDEGVDQCIAEMYAAQLFNQKKGKVKKAIYGAVTFGFEWKFIRLVEKQADIDYEVYFLNDLPKLLGALQYIIDLASEELK
jgi:hypothetical protein